MSAFSGRHAVVTGGSSGIGLALSRLLVGQGADLSLVARDRSKLDAAGEQVEAAKAAEDQRVRLYCADVSDRMQVETAFSAILRDQGPPDLLVTSAGVAHPGHFLDLPEEVFERAMAVNYFGTLYAVRAALPSMVERRKGRLVLISSGAGLIGTYGYTAYSPSKFALRGLAEALRGELGQSGIGVSIVYPPDTDTPQLREENKTKPEVAKRITGTARTRSAEAVAEKIMQGIEKGAFAITPGWEMTLFFRFQSFLAPLAQRYFDYLAGKAEGGRRK
jgi:3-dehydrosphinganine reductase